MTNVEYLALNPDRIVTSIARLMRQELVKNTPITRQMVRSWSDFLDRAIAIAAAQNEAEQIARENRIETIGSDVISAAAATNLKNHAAWLICQLATDASKFSTAAEAHENEAMACQILETLNTLTDGICRPVGIRQEQ